MAKLYEFDQCEASTADGTRCSKRGNDYVKNPGAYLPFLVCGMHKRAGERMVAANGGVPRTWGKYNFRGPSYF